MKWIHRVEPNVQWQKVFAWFPVRIGTIWPQNGQTVVWLEWVERKFIDNRGSTIYEYRKLNATPTHTTTPCERLTQFYLQNFGRFSINRAWQLDCKLIQNLPLTDEEQYFVRVCLMREHTKREPEIFVDDNKGFPCGCLWKVENDPRGKITVPC